MSEDWTIQALTSRYQTDPSDWAGIAGAISDVVHAMAAVVEGPTPRWLDWSGAHHPTGESLFTLVLAKRERHDDGDLVGGGSSVGELRGQLPDGRWLASLSWELGGQQRDGSVRVRFEADTAGPLPEQPPSRLAELLCAVCGALGADRGQVTTRRLSRALGRRNASLAVGALTLLPRGLPAGMAAPPGFATVDAPSGYPGGVVLIAPPEQVAEQPEAVAEALSEIDEQLASRPDESRLPPTR